MALLKLGYTLVQRWNVNVYLL